MAGEQGRELRRLAKKHRISVKPPVSSKEDWPSSYRSAFGNITKIGVYTHEHFVASIDPFSDQQPWREKTKFRAEWLAKKAGRLFQQQRNEAGWRFGIENDVFQRFGLEVACPGCRARLWRSELEAAIDTSNDIAREIIERRKDRKPCQCPPEKRSRDYYEIGTNPLFDDRVQEVVLHNPLQQCSLPKQEPDRVYGLRETKNFKDLFSQPTARSSILQGKDIGESVQSSPFKDISDPLLFPFLILEAKSEKSSSGFDDISFQTAFPILALLKLQEDLAHQVNDDKLDDGPLVWFFASRGDAWRVYGCYVTEETPAGYNIVQLWEGSILSNDKALQLILIVDYVFDWARDIYRPSILRQLKSLTRVDSYDKISAAHDSDIHSMRRKISSWIQPPKDLIDLTREKFDPSQDVSQNEPTSKHERRLLALSEDHNPSNSNCFRSPAFTTTRMVGLYLTEANTRSMLQWAGANDHNKHISRTACRTLVNFITQWDELMLLSNRDLLDLESLWVGSPSPVNEHLESESANLDLADTYVLLEYAMYMDESWRIVREITYLAISKSAFEILIKYADFRQKHDGISSISESLRPCGADVLKEAIRCLKSGSVHQIFLAAVSCSCYALFLLQRKATFGQGSPTLAIGLEKLPHSRLRGIIAKYHAYCLPQISKASSSSDSSPKRQRVETSRHDLESDSCLPDRSFVRITERKDDISVNPDHDHNVCQRCNRSGTEVFPYSRLDKSPFTETGIAIVTALAFDKDRGGSPQFCIFAQDVPEGISTSTRPRIFYVEYTRLKMVKDVSRSDKIYQTVKHPVPNYFAKANTHYEVRWNSVVWNLPPTMHPLDIGQQEAFDIWMRWLSKRYIRLRSSDIRDTWNSQQMSLFLLKAGHTWEEANKTVENHREEVKKSMEGNARMRGSKKANGIIDMRARLYALYADKARENQEKKREEAGEDVKESCYTPSQQRGAGKKLRWRDGNVSEYDGHTLNFLNKVG